MCGIDDTGGFSLLMGNFTQTQLPLSQSYSTADHASDPVDTPLASQEDAEFTHYLVNIYSFISFLFVAASADL
jgi:hypothetical protein